MAMVDPLETEAKALEDQAEALELAGRPIAAQARLQQAKSKRDQAQTLRSAGMFRHSVLAHRVGITPVVFTTSLYGTRPSWHRCDLPAQMPSALVDLHSAASSSGSQRGVVAKVSLSPSCAAQGHPAGVVLLSSCWRQS